MKDESNCFDIGNLTTAKPVVSDSLLVELARPEFSGDLMLKQPTISGDMTLKQPRISRDLSQQFIHLLMPPVKNSNQEKLR